MSWKTKAGGIISWIFGILVLAAGAVNTFWGNDPFFGVAMVFLSLIYLPPANTVIKKWTGFSIPVAAKIIVGLLVLWAALGVGELFDKIHLMMIDFSALLN